MLAEDQRNMDATTRPAHPVTDGAETYSSCPGKSLYSFSRLIIHLQVHMRYPARHAVQTQEPVHVQSAVQTAVSALVGPASVPYQTKRR